MGVCGKKIHHWYKEYLSGFRDKNIQEKLHEYDIEDPDIIDRETGKPRTVLVPIFKPSNFGRNMCMDDKNVGGRGYLIFSNTDTKKIALMVETTKLKLVKNIIHLLPTKIQFEVETMTRDLGTGYHWFCKEVFPRIREQIADKFHIIKDGIGALQDIRIRYRQIELRKKRLAYEEHKEKEKERKENCKNKGLAFIKRRFVYKEKKLSNGETLLQLLAKSKYVLCKFPHQWYPNQEERAKILFEQFPEIERGYNLICALRSFYSVKVGNRKKAETLLKKWFLQVESEDIEEISNFSSMIERNYTEIMNYFNEGRTNAYAEGLNSQIEKFLHSNSGARDRDFFHFRLIKYFS